MTASLVLPQRARVGALALLVPATGLRAQVAAPRLELTATALLVEVRTRARLDGALGGTTLDAERDLGLRRRMPTPGLRLRWRIARRHELELGAQRVRRGTERALAQDVIWGDSTFPAGATVRARFDSDNILATWRAALHVGRRSEWGIGVGAGALLLDLRLAAGAGLAAGGDTVVERRSVGRALPAPVATLGGYGRWRPADAWRIEVDARALAASAGRFRAETADARLLVRRTLGRRLALEAGGSLESFGVGVARADDARRGERAGVRVTYRQLQAQLGLSATLR